MKTVTYIKRNYPEPTNRQLQKESLLQSDELFIEEEGIQEIDVLEQLFRRLQEGDCLKLYTIQVLLVTKNPIQWMAQLVNRSIRLVTIQEGIDTNEDLLYLPRSFELLKLQKDCRRNRVKQALALRRSEGKLLGRPTISKETIDFIVQLYHKNKYSYREIAEKSGVSLGTAHKYANERKEANDGIKNL